MRPDVVSSRNKSRDRRGGVGVGSSCSELEFEVGEDAGIEVAAAVDWNLFRLIWLCGIEIAEYL